MRTEPNATPTPAGDAPATPAVDRASFPPFVASLLRPEAYPHAANDIELHETHISWVILAGSFAYKLKKPVDLGFLDFTTIERRAADCADEVRLNRRLCPDVYLGVIDVVARDGAYFVGGPGETVEPAVWMRRLPEDGMLPALLARGAADTDMIHRIARRVATFHADAATGPGVDEYGSFSTIQANWDENFEQTAPFVGRTLAPSVRTRIAEYIARFLTEQRWRIERRVAEGRVRDGHGDLHASSICIEGDQVQIFDCLEFAPRFRCSDVAAEVAFLAMDLDHFGRADLGGAFVDEYVRCSGDTELYALLDFYKCYRAYVRAKVASLRLVEPGLSEAEEASVTDDARAYFELAQAYTSGPG